MKPNFIGWPSLINLSYSVKANEWGLSWIPSDMLCRKHLQEEKLAQENQHGLHMFTSINPLLHSLQFVLSSYIQKEAAVDCHWSNMRPVGCSLVVGFNIGIIGLSPFPVIFCSWRERVSPRKQSDDALCNAEKLDNPIHILTHHGKIFSTCPAPNSL